MCSQESSFWVVRLKQLTKFYDALLYKFALKMIQLS